MDYLIILFLVLFVIFMLASWLFPWITARKARGQDAGALQKVLNLDDGRHLVYFWSPSCGHCRAMTSAVNQIMERREDVHALNLVDHAAMSKALGVMGTPAIVIINRARIEGVFLGAKTPAQIEKLLADNDHA